MPLPLLILACALACTSLVFVSSVTIFAPDSPIMKPLTPPGIDRPPGEIIIEVPIEITLPSFWDYLSDYMNDILILSCIILLIIGLGWWFGRSKRKTIERTAKQLRGDR